MIEEIECAHYETISRENVGTCVYCGQVKQYPGGDIKKLVILKEGDPEKANLEGHMKALKKQIPTLLEGEQEGVEVTGPNWEKHSYYEDHKAEILADIKSIGRGETEKSWEIKSGAMTHLLHRWLSPDEIAALKIIGHAAGVKKRAEARQRSGKTQNLRFGRSLLRYLVVA